VNKGLQISHLELGAEQLLRQLFDAAVQAALPDKVLRQVAFKPPVGRTLVLGAGKAAASMALALDGIWPADKALSGLVVTRYDHIPPEGRTQASISSCRIEMIEAAHPVPDLAGVQASQRILQLAQGLSANDLVIFLVSGGGSSLLTLPVEGLELEDKKSINLALLRSGANIQEMNCVRKHLSRIKGGRLALACAPARVLTLAISDVPGDDPSVIASGPTVADESTCAQVLEILDKYSVKVPPLIRLGLETGELETPKPGDAFAHCEPVQLIATPKQSLKAAAKAAQAMGLRAYILSDDLEGESSQVAKVHAALARECAKTLHETGLEEVQDFCAFTPPCVLLSGGETTVTIQPAISQETSDNLNFINKGQINRVGRGGRAGEFCLSLAHELGAHSRIWALAADTDGIDGVENNAGACVKPDTLQRAKELGLHTPDYLARHDSFTYFEALGDLVLTGPTYTNVNDFRAILVR
jgi:hydroxypyruvate reductase